MNNKKPQVLLVKIMKNGSDVGVFLGSELILNADPSAGEDVTAIETVACKLAISHGVDVVLLEHKPKEGWNWDEVAADLSDEGYLTSEIKEFEFSFETISADGDTSEDCVVFEGFTTQEATQKFLTYTRCWTHELVSFSCTYCDDEKIKRDLFEYLAAAPDSLAFICNRWKPRLAVGDAYQVCKFFLAEVEVLGYTFDYNLDGKPFNLRTK